MKRLVITWNVIKDGRFPVEEVKKVGMVVTEENSSAIIHTVIISLPSGEDISHELTFYLGMLVQSHRIK